MHRSAHSLLFLLYILLYTHKYIVLSSANSRIVNKTINNKNISKPIHKIFCAFFYHIHADPHNVKVKWTTQNNKHFSTISQWLNICKYVRCAVCALDVIVTKSFRESLSKNVFMYIRVGTYVYVLCPSSTARPQTSTSTKAASSAWFYIWIFVFSLMVVRCA